MLLLEILRFLESVRSPLLRCSFISTLPVSRSSLVFPTAPIVGAIYLGSCFDPLSSRTLPNALKLFSFGVLDVSGPLMLILLMVLLF
jgi:hypothetical protein